MKWFFFLLLIAIILSMFKGRMHDSYRRYTAHLQIEAPGGCLDVSIDGDTSFRDMGRSIETDHDFSIYHGAGYGPSAWTFHAKSGGIRNRPFVFWVEAMFDEARPIKGRGCYTTDFFGSLKLVTKKMQGQPDVPYEDCSIIDSGSRHVNYMLFSDVGDAVANVRCSRFDTTGCTGDIEIDGAMFHLGMVKNDVRDLGAIREQMASIIRKNMAFKSKCTLW